MCSLDTTSLWDIVISSAFVPEKDKKGAAWDLLNGAPDPYLDIFTSEGTSSHSGGTLEDRDTTFAVWLETPLKGVKASEIIKSTSIEVWDYDDEITNDDFMGGCKVPITAAMFTGTLQFYTCPVTATGGAIDLAFKLVPHVP